MGSENQGAITRVTGVYDADGTIAGELSHFLGARFGRTHCALCDITHGWVRERSAWRVARDRLPVPFVAFHRDDQPDAVRAATGSAAPVIVAETTAGEVVVLLDSDELESCAGSPERLVEAITGALRARGLAWADEST
ncbi:MAG: hypothetical protein ACRD0U_00640 [Acidimicrobiales bacterium]